MYDFVNRLPWRLAAAAGLLIGLVSGASGTDLWYCLLRVGIGFLIFGFAGMGLRLILLQSEALKPPAPTRGRHIDRTLPPLTPEDLEPPRDKP